MSGLTGLNCIRVRSYIIISGACIFIYIRKLKSIKGITGTPKVSMSYELSMVADKNFEGFEAAWQGSCNWNNSQKRTIIGRKKGSGVCRGEGLLAKSCI